MAALKTQRNTANVDDFVDAVDDEVRKADCLAVMDIMASATGEAPEMWRSILPFSLLSAYLLPGASPKHPPDP